MLRKTSCSTSSARVSSSRIRRASAKAGRRNRVYRSSTACRSPARIRCTREASAGSSAGRRSGGLTTPIVTRSFRGGQGFRFSDGRDRCDWCDECGVSRIDSSPGGHNVVVRNMARGSVSRYSCPLTLQLIGPRSWTEVPALLSYEAADPFAVRITFGDMGSGPTAADDGVTWLVGRVLLRIALDRPAGDGDVRVWPASATADVLFLHLRAPSGEALFELSRATLATFLRQSEVLVPSGTESTVLALDDALAALLSNGDADPTGR